MRPEKLVIDVIEAESWASEQYRIEAVASELPGDIDRNVLLTAEEGTRWLPERELLPNLIVARLCNSLLMSAQARSMAPDDESVRISERPASDLLKRLSS